MGVSHGELEIPPPGRAGWFAGGPRPADARPGAPGNPRDLDDRLAELHEMTADLRDAGLITFTM